MLHGRRQQHLHVPLPAMQLMLAVTGGRMLTTATNEADTDHALLNRWGLVGMRAFESRTMAPHAARCGSASASEALPMDAAAL